mgnify:CR=1 FL=1
MKVFNTAAVSNSQGGSQSDAIDWRSGLITGTSDNLTIDYGNTTTWNRDVSWGIHQNGRKLHENDSCYIEGDNGKEHHANYKQESNSLGLFIKMNFVYGFAIDFRQNNKDGHSLWLRNCGIESVTDAGNIKRWGSYEGFRWNDTNWHTYKFEFSDSEQQGMSEYNARFKQFICRISSRGGVGSRKTRLHLAHFRLLYKDTGCESGRWVLPSARDYSDRKNPDIIVP